MLKGIGPVIVYRSREMIDVVDERFTSWKYHASSPNRFFPKGDRFLGESSIDLDSLAQTILNTLTPEEKISIISRCPSSDNKIGEDNPSMHIDSRGIIKHYDRLKVSELELLGRAMSKYRRTQDA